MSGALWSASWPAGRMCSLVKSRVALNSPYLIRSSCLCWLVGEPNSACRVRLGVDEPQRRSACVLKEPLAIAQDQRTDDEQILIDEVMIHECMDQVSTSQDRYGLTKLLLELSTSSAILLLISLELF